MKILPNHVFMPPTNHKQLRENSTDTNWFDNGQEPHVPLMSQEDWCATFCGGGHRNLNMVSAVRRVKPSFADHLRAPVRFGALLQGVFHIARVCVQ